MNTMYARSIRDRVRKDDYFQAARRRRDTWLGSRLKHTAFTLVELLVVIFIIAMLVAILVPNLSKAMSVSRRVQCAKQLHDMGVAAGAIRSSGDTAYNPEPLLTKTGWGGQLLAKLNEESFICPEEDPMLPIDAVRHPHPMSNLGGYSIYNKGLGHYTPLEEGAWMVKLSQTQFNNAKNQGYLRDKGRWWNPWTYEPDNNPGHYYLCYEGMRWKQIYNNRQEKEEPDFDDIIIEVELQPGGETRVTSRYQPGPWPPNGSTIYTHAMVNEEGEKFFDPLNFYPTPTIFDVDTGMCSYGINYNDNVRKLESMGKKVLLLDYEAMCAEEDDEYWETGQTGDRDGDGTLDIARHSGKMNVLYLDGSVEAKRPEEINPQGDSKIRNRIWEEN